MSDAKKEEWAGERLRRLIEQARARRMEFKEINLATFDPELAGQTLRVWVNAPSALARHIYDVDLGEDGTVGALAEYLYRPTGERYTTSELQDLLDAWEGTLRRWIIRQIFAQVNEYVAERNSFLDSLPTDGPSRKTSTSETSSAPAT